MSRLLSSRAVAAGLVAVALSAGAAAQSMCVLTCPANINVGSLPGQQVSAPINYTVPVPNGCSTPTAVQTSGIPTGGQFAVGTTINSFAVLLMSGGTEASCQFSVTVTATPAAPVPPSQVPVMQGATLAGLAVLIAAGAAAWRRRRSD